MIAPPTFYDILGVDKDASASEIRKAYKQRALETHPDKLEPGASSSIKQVAEARFRMVREAFEVLGDPQMRRAYDVRINAPAGERRDWMQFSAEQVRRMKDREMWARQAEEEHQARMQALREQNRMVREEIREKAAEVSEYASMVEKMLQQLCERNPEWEARKKNVQRRRAEYAKQRGYTVS